MRRIDPLSARRLYGVSALEATMVRIRQVSLLAPPEHWY